MSTGLVAKSSLQGKILSASVILLSGSTMAVGLNLGYNVAVAHFLGPKGFGNANALFTLLTLISAVTLSFQIVTSKIVAQHQDAAGRDAAFRYLQRAAWIGGLVTAAILIALQVQISNYLDLPGPRLVMILTVGAAFYVPLGARRGYIQGAYGFRKFATNLVLEGAVRLAGSVLMVVLGFGVTGVIVANVAAVAVAYFAIAPRLSLEGSNPLSFENTFSEVSHAVVFFGGQVLINNCDIVLVKHFFASGDAGLYAAIAMVGRVTFACSQAIVNGMFPVVAGSNREERKSLTLIGTALGLVLAVGCLIAVVLRFSPSWVWTILFGASFHIAGPHGFPFLLALYAITTVIYSLSVVVMTYEMSYKIANTTWYQLLLSAVLIAGICRYHHSLEQVILVQLILLTAFLVVIAVPFLIDTLRETNEAERSPLRVVRSLREDDVISEFLKSDFQHSAYSDYYQSLRDLVFRPDMANETECANRRALLQVRHRALWKELPVDTQWFLVEVAPANLPQIRVFPRAQWTRVARGNYGILKVAERLKARHREESSFVNKISDIREVLAEDVLNTGAVILIGLDPASPLTVLDGNHRFVAATIEGKLSSLKFVCGFSPNMGDCCWYKTSFFNLVRYGRNLIKQFFDPPTKDVLQFSATSTRETDSASEPDVVNSLLL